MGGRSQLRRLMKKMERLAAGRPGAGITILEILCGGEPVPADLRYVVPAHREGVAELVALYGPQLAGMNVRDERPPAEYEERVRRAGLPRMTRNGKSEP